MKYRIRHYTEYDYDAVVSSSCNRLCLAPNDFPEQECISTELSITPKPDEVIYRTDFFGNQLAFFSIYQEHKKLRINCNSVVRLETRLNDDAARQSMIGWEDMGLKLSLGPTPSHEVMQYLLPSMYIPQSEMIRAFAAGCFHLGGTLWDGCMNLMTMIFKTIEFKPGFTTVNTPVETVIKMKKGVCQDMAHLMIACLRNMNIPARYVSGYLETIPPSGKKKLVGADASHAWVSVYFPGVGWVEFDPTNNLLPQDNHILIGYGRDYQDVAPIKGIVFSSGKQELTVKVDVERLG
jgi:transglutaminase-like putative cysteine protease